MTFEIKLGQDVPVTTDQVVRAVQAETRRGRDEQEIFLMGALSEAVGRFTMGIVAEADAAAELESGEAIEEAEFSEVPENDPSKGGEFCDEQA